MQLPDFRDPDAVPDAELARAQVRLDVTIGGRDAGAMTLEFWPEAAPRTVRNFLGYVADGFYDGLGFHRVISGFTIQGGCPRGDGTGDGPRGNIPGEFSSDPRHSHARGVISMARAQDPDSASCQFFICHQDASFLDGQYAAFGRLVAGHDTLDAIATVATQPGSDGARSRPAEPVLIRSARIEMGAES